MSSCSTACFSGIHSLPAAILFALIYLPLFVWHSRQAVIRPTYVLVVLSFFCAIRIATFTTRAVLAASEGARENKNLLIANQIIYSAGFFGLLYSTYTLVLDRDLILGPPRKNGIVGHLTRDRRVFRIALIAAVSLGITGACYTFLASKPSSITLGHTLRKASVIIFLVLTVLLALQTWRVARYELKYEPNIKGVGVGGRASVGGVQAVHVLVAISLVLLAREVFFTATMDKLDVQLSERYWYPFAALTEFVAVCLLAMPGLIPARSDLPS